MDRLARNLDDLRGLVQTLTRRGVHIVFIKERLTFAGEDSPLAHLMLSVTRRARACQVSCGRGHRFDPVMVAKTGLRTGAAVPPARSRSRLGKYPTRNLKHQY